MKAFFVMTLGLFALAAGAQTLANFAGDYKLSFSVSACNPNARVEVSSTKVKIINQDPRDNRGWSTEVLTIGETSSSSANGDVRATKVSVIGKKIVREETIKRAGREVGYTKDEFEFTEKNGKKGLMIRLEVETRGNVSGYGTTCGYDKL